MTKRHKCPRCDFNVQFRAACCGVILCVNKTYVIRRQKRSKYEWQPGRFPLRFEASEREAVLIPFLKGFSSNGIAPETSFDRKRILRALLLVRQVMTADIPRAFSGKVEVDETYLGGQWKNKRLSDRSRGPKRGRGTSKTPVFGILCRSGKVWAEVVPDVEARTLIPLIKSRVKRGSTVFSDTWTSYTGIAAKEYVHCFVEHGK